MKKTVTILRRIAPQLGVIVLMTAVLTRLSPNFLTPGNINNLFSQQLPYLFIPALAMMLSVILGDLDLSLGANIAFSSCVCGVLAKSIGYVPAVLIALTVGVLIGASNGVLIARVRLPAFITTYGMNWIITGAATGMMMGTTAFSFDEGFRNAFVGSSFGLAHELLYMALFTLLLAFLLNRTVFGRNLYAYGFNQTAARFAGVRTQKQIITLYSLSGFLAAFTGILYTAKLDAADSTLGEGWNIKLIAAVLVGGASMGGGSAWILNTLLGAFIMVLITNATNLLNISSLWQQFVIGCVILLSILFKKIRLPRILRTTTL